MEKEPSSINTEVSKRRFSSSIIQGLFLINRPFYFVLVYTILLFTIVCSNFVFANRQDRHERDKDDYNLYYKVQRRDNRNDGGGFDIPEPRYYQDGYPSPSDYPPPPPP